MDPEGDDRLTDSEKTWLQMKLRQVFIEVGVQLNYAEMNALVDDLVAQVDLAVRASNGQEPF